MPPPGGVIRSNASLPEDEKVPVAARKRPARFGPAQNADNAWIWYLNKEGNRLADALSPYLRQHAANPVAWQPWDDAALREAARRDVPIMLSIGYTACHWCHVMERESFSSPDIAGLLNRDFVCVKVDREERPDLDRLFQSAHYLLSRTSGGWPLTVFLTPDRVPFFSGTYFPPQQQGTMQSFASIIEKVGWLWRERREQVESQNRRVMLGLHMIDRSIGRDRGAPPAAADLCKWADGMLDEFDALNGGLGKAPKFPQVPALLFMLEMAQCGFGGDRLRESLKTTFDVISVSGLHDHVDGGFFRYCVDPQWEIPHFEKMLSDNALMIEIYALASIVLSEPDYGDLAVHTAEWMLRGMRGAHGGFVSSIDADAGGIEGGSYVWTARQLAEALSDSQIELLGRKANTSSVTNFADAWHIRLRPQIRWSRPPGELQGIFAAMREARKERVQPVVDDKVLALSCGLAGRALARAGRLLARPEWLDQARAALAFSDRSLVRAGRLRTAWRDGRCSEAPACLDDHAIIASAWLELFKGSGRAADLQSAVAAAATMLAEFDDRRGGLRLAGRAFKDSRRIVRSGEDSSIPSGNGVAAQLLLELGWLAGDSRMLAAAERILGAFAGLIRNSGRHCPSLLAALWRRNVRAKQVAVFGDADETGRWCAQLAAANPFQAVYPVGVEAGLPGLLAQPRPPARTCAKVCRAGACGLPNESLPEALAQAGYDWKETGL